MKKDKIKAAADSNLFIFLNEEMERNGTNMLTVSKDLGYFDSRGYHWKSIKNNTIKLKEAIEYIEAVGLGVYIVIDGVEKKIDLNTNVPFFLLQELVNQFGTLVLRNKEKIYFF